MCARWPKRIHANRNPDNMSGQRVDDPTMAESPFDRLPDKYDQWFESPRGRAIFQVEAKCLRGLLVDVPHPWLEAGVGTGRFAAALGVDEGIDPSAAVLEFAARRGISTCLGSAEDLPYPAGSFGGVLMVVTVCFLNDAPAAMRECARVLADGGSLIVGFVPADSSWGRLYAMQAQDGHPFYSLATFYTAPQVIELAGAVGLHLQAARSCLFTPPDLPVDPLQPPRDGIVSDAGFVALRFMRAESDQDESRGRDSGRTG